MQHLDECADCQRQLERTAARAVEWEIVRELRSRLNTGFGGSSSGTSDVDEAFAFDVSPADFGVHYLTPATSPDSIGQLDDIEILDVVGRGGMGIVLKGRQTSLQRLVAVKLLRPDLAAHGVARRRFTREAQATAAIVHPNVMPIHAIRTTGRLPYLVMPFLDCESLEQRIQRSGPLDPLSVLTLGLQMARALEAAHAQGLVHRDVKPANILLERTGPRAWLADFGLARAMDDATLTRSGFIPGTPLYMSPEQARGEAIDGRSDLFSLGSVLYMMCAGRPPFRAETTYGVLRRIMESRPRSIRELEPSLPEWMELLIDRFLEKRPERRIATATAAAELLEQTLRFHQQPETQELPRSLIPNDRRRSRRRRTQSQAASSHFPWHFLYAFLIGGLIMLALLVPLAMLAPPLLALLTVAAPTEPGTQVPEVTPQVESLLRDSAEPETPLVVADNGSEQKDETKAVESKYASADEALRVGSGFLAQMEYAQSQEPLEEALKLAPDDEYRVKVYRALIPAYTIAPDWTLKLKALEFIIRHSERDAERSLARTELMSFVRQRGKTKDTVKHFEEQLKVNKDDESALYILTEVYSRLTNEPQKAAAVLEQLTKLKQKSGQELSVAESAKLAAEYVKSRKYKEGAELFEATAARDKTLAAWHYKEAANAWLNGKDKTKALAAAKASAESEPEKRSELLIYFWHRSLGDVFSDCGEAALAVPHYEQALASTKIDGYRKETEQKLARARELAQ
ncbi:MAG: hypothetical protein B7Z55_01685 [Planctomycetales bacterium 12-60-4]|nr:MAG: hypothetical protein B7Z55_01685 [Planctomycetales bacterium 12-60-4]